MHKIQKRIISLAGKEDISALGYRKLGDKIGVDHPQQVKYHLQKLISSGQLVRTPFGVLKVSQPSATVAKVFQIPILGQANCGQPLSVAEESGWGTLTITPSLVKIKDPAKLFAVRTIGDSMNRANVGGQAINNGDYVIVDSSVELPQNGDYVLSSVGGLANVKKYLRDDINRLIRLKSESSIDYPPIVIDPDDVDSYHIHGRIVRVIRPA
ncbi:MAG TPA: S24 family peptidase [Candidatus Saccharimonadales bacterium]|jgi:repressor LexA